MTNMTPPTLPGLHHVTAITGDVRRNVAFYTGTLGLRMVKVTVNYDDPTSYHLYYADRLGTPGTLMTFFGWPDAPRVRSSGTGQTGATAYAADPASLPFWRGRLVARGVAVEESTRFGEPVLRFADPDGMTLEIIGSPESDPARAWTEGGVPAEHALRGFHSVTLLEAGRTATETLLTEQLGFERVATEGDRTRFRAAGATSAAYVDVVERPGAPRGRDGVGQVHHVAFRTADDAAQLGWQEKVARLGLRVSPVMDRDYFHSIYFRDPGGVLFEIATDPPGFLTDETPAELGMHLKLPAWLESHRTEIEANLPPLKLAEPQGELVTA